MSAVEAELKNYDKTIHDLEAIQIENVPGGESLRVNASAWPEERVVGFKDEEMTIKEKLTGGPKRLEVILIVGMAGQGKTTLAKKVYNDPLVVYHFYLRAWINVSQEYQKRDLLLGLSSCVGDHSNEINQMSDEKLGERLYKSLKGRVYFIVMDDVWDGRAWADLKEYFPNDRNGSRILFTGRHKDVALAHPVSYSLPLPFLTDDESWELFRLKVFQRGTCPSELKEIGMQIAKKCRGLPLAIVVVAGIIANEEKRKDRWEEVGKIMKQCMGGNPELCMTIFKLSYDHLPCHLKPCFLYFGAFPEDSQIRARKLIWLWIAEGFIQKTREKNLEDVAEEYLMNLIYRSLIIVSKRGYEGRTKTCSIHDLLREFCLKQAEEENFLRKISGVQEVSSSSSCPRVLCIDSLKLQTVRLPFVLDPHSFLCIGCGYGAGLLPLAFLFQGLKLLRVLDVSSIQLGSYPMEIEQLGFLRYLALSLLMASLPASICNLCNLETLIIFGTWTSLSLPVGKMEKLRHVLLNGPVMDQPVMDQVMETLLDDYCRSFLMDPVIDRRVETLLKGYCKSFLMDQVIDQRVDRVMDQDDVRLMDQYKARPADPSLVLDFLGDQVRTTDQDVARPRVLTCGSAPAEPPLLVMDQVIDQRVDQVMDQDDVSLMDQDDACLADPSLVLDFLGDEVKATDQDASPRWSIAKGAGHAEPSLPVMELVIDQRVKALLEEHCQFFLMDQMMDRVEAHPADPSLPLMDQVIDQRVKALLEERCGFFLMDQVIDQAEASPAEPSLPLMDSLQTLLWVNPKHCQSILNRAPNLRKLGIQGKIVIADLLLFPRLTFLQHLQKLKLFNTSKVRHSVYLRSYNFPRNLKKLSLHGTNLGWDEISRFGKLLPNLEVLKLLAGACSGSFWVTGEVEFPKLKFLKFESLDIECWKASSNHFPSLQRLALIRCAFLKQIPFDIGQIPTLQMIEICHCNRYVANSAREIKQEQESMGNHYLQITVESPFSRFFEDNELC